MSLKKFFLYSLIILNLIVSQNKQISVGNVKFIGNNNLSNKALLKQVELKTSSLFRFSDIDFDRRLNVSGFISKVLRFLLLIPIHSTSIFNTLESSS